MKRKIFVSSFFIILVGWMVISFLKPDVYYSKKENRLAAQAPSFSVTTYQSREWMEDSEAYVEDQMAYRNTMLDVKFISESVLGKKENNGIYQGKDGFSLKIETYQDEMIKTATKQIQTLLQKKKGSFVLMPTSAYILGDKLPAFQEDKTQTAWFQILKQYPFVVSGDDPLSQIGEQGFYRSDHHINMRGNEAIYHAWTKHQGVEAKPTTFEQVYDQFLGSYYRTSSNPFQMEDIMEIASDKDSYITSIVYDEVKTATTLYEQSYLGKTDEYAMYLDGNHARTTISTTSENKQHLVVFKDSYGNSFVPYLVPHYAKITMVDLRFDQVDVEALIKESDEVMFCYSLAGLQEKHVVDALQKLHP